MVNMQILKLLFLITILLNTTKCRKLPSFITPCNIDEKDMNKCVETKINGMRNEMADGIKEFGLPPLKLIPITELSLAIDNGNSNMSLVFNDLLFKGAENFELKGVNFDVDNRVFTLNLFVPLFQMTSKYRMKGRMILLDLDATGNIAMNFTGVTITDKFIGDVNVKDGDNYLKLHADEFNVHIDDMKMEFTDLVNGNQELTTAVNNAFDENSKDLLKEVQPSVNEAIKQLITVIINNVFDRYSINELFPKS